MCVNHTFFYMYMYKCTYRYIYWIVCSSSGPSNINTNDCWDWLLGWWKVLLWRHHHKTDSYREQFQKAMWYTHGYQVNLFQVMSDVLYFYTFSIGKEEHEADKLQSILAQLEYKHWVDKYVQKGVPFNKHLYCPEKHPNFSVREKMKGMFWRYKYFTYIMYSVFTTCLNVHYTCITADWKKAYDLVVHKIFNSSALLRLSIMKSPSWPILH